MIAVFMIAAICVAIDQLTKLLVVSSIPLGESVPLIDGVLRLTYIKNEGAAFGSLAGARWVFMIASVLLIVLLTLFTVKKRPTKIPLCIALGFLIGGGIGNMIDRIFLGYVVDFIDFCAFPDLWKWIFNGADSFVTVGAAMLIILFIKDDGLFSLKGAASDSAAADSPAEAEDEGSLDNTKGGTDDETA